MPNDNEFLTAESVVHDTPETSTATTVSSAPDDLPKPPSGRRSRTRPAGPPAPVSEAAAPAEPPAVAAPAEPQAMAAPVARLAVEAGVEPLALEGASEPQAPVEPAARPATRRRRSVRAASATAEAEQSKTEPEQSKTEESQSEIGAALEAASKSVRGTRRRSNRTTARKLAGTHELPTDEHGEVSAAAVLESLAAAIAGDATAEQVEPALASGDVTREQEPESQPLAERQPVDETAPEVVGEPAQLAGDDAESAAEEAEPVTEEGGDESESDEEQAPRRRRRRRGGRRRNRGIGADDGSDVEETTEEAADEAAVDEGAEAEESTETDGASRRRRRRRRRRGEDTGGSADDPSDVVVRVREPRRHHVLTDEITGIEGSTRMEAKRQRRREGRAAGRRRAPILSEAEFLARREAVDRRMVIRQTDQYTQLAVLEDGVLVEHYVDRASAASSIGNIYLGRVQNVLPSMEAAFIDIGRGRNAVLYAGEVDWGTYGVTGGDRKIEQVLKSGNTVLVQVSKDPVGAKGARLTGHISLPGRYVVYSPDGNLSGISRKLPENERHRLKTLLNQIVGEDASVIVRTAAEGATEEALHHDVDRLKAQWQVIEKKVKQGKAPQQLYAEPDLTLRVVRDLFTEDFKELVVAGHGGPDDAYEVINDYVTHVAPHLADRLVKWDPEAKGDPFTKYRIDEQIGKALERKVFLPSGGSLVIDRTEAMTVIDVNTGKFTGSGGNLEETVTRNNLEAAEEIVRQLRLRDLGGIIVVDFIDMVLPSNRELLLRRLVECLGRDRTRHQVSEVTSLGLVQMTRKKIGTGLAEAFTEACDQCGGRGYLRRDTPVDSQAPADGGERGQQGTGQRRSRGTGGGGNRQNSKSDKVDEDTQNAGDAQAPTQDEQG